jgi:hypothetical protein
MVLNEHIFNLPHLVDGVEDLFRLRALDKGIELVVELSPDLPRFVFADESKLRQILINLVGNALKFTNQGKVQVQARLATDGEVKALFRDPEQPGVWLNFIVQDSGTGIAEQDLERIFEPFFQVVHERNAQQGTGLGLAISKQYVNLMGGEILVQSLPDRGSTFSCLIPVHSTMIVESLDSQGRGVIGSALDHLPPDSKASRVLAENYPQGSPESNWEVLPEEDVASLRQAALLGDLDQIWLIIQQISVEHPELAEILVGYASRYDLRGLMAQLQVMKVEKEGSDGEQPKR